MSQYNTGAEDCSNIFYSVFFRAPQLKSHEGVGSFKFSSHLLRSNDAVADMLSTIAVEVLLWGWRVEAICSGFSTILSICDKFHPSWPQQFQTVTYNSFVCWVL